MAILKSKTLPNLLEVSYWRIVRINHLSKDGTEVLLGGFQSKDTSDQIGDQALLDVISFHFPIEKDVFISQNVYHKIYYLIKESNIVDGVETNFFADAEDV